MRLAFFCFYCQLACYEINSFFCDHASSGVLHTQNRNQTMEVIFFLIVNHHAVPSQFNLFLVSVFFIYRKKTPSHMLDMFQRQVEWRMSTVDFINKALKNIFGHAEFVWCVIPRNVPGADHSFIPPWDE